MPISPIAVTLTETNPIAKLLDQIENHKKRCLAGGDGWRCAMCGVTEDGAVRVDSDNMVAEARELLEALILPDVHLHLEPGAVAMLKTLHASGLYGCDLEEVCIRLVCEGLERRIDTMKSSGTGVRLTIPDE